MTVHTKSVHLLALATISLTSLAGAGVGVGSWVAMNLFNTEHETKMFGNTKCQSSVYMKPVIKGNQE
jgi:hypothetical protein